MHMGKKKIHTDTDCHPTFLKDFPTSVFNLDHGFGTYTTSSIKHVPSVFIRFSILFVYFHPVCDHR